ncbi:MAG: aminotransferase class I/II-fold pyridoxal phosphate-dependent enzyme [Flavobacteriales bacterium]|nr:aminotransferase class I/II-fold pyridoxal phosphate-dependent enzyme [Flavobacteriales bacterium]
MIIDLRSDTVTRPTPEMKEFMWNASVGDDVFSEDPTLNELQEYAADMFGMEAALFCPSGTMTNQIAIKVQTQPGDEVICESGAHIHYYEGGGLAFNSGVSVKPIIGNRGVFTADQVSSELRPENVHFSRTSVVAIENTCNRGGGKVFDFEEIVKIGAVCEHNDMRLHLDGARLFNSIVAEARNPKEFGKLFDSISICLSKGLGAPVGSLLLGDKKLIEKALRIRKVLGGGMRQAGYMAAAGLYALQNNVDRLEQDHQLAKDIESCLQRQTYVENVLPVETNIVVFDLVSEVDVADFLSHLENLGIKCFEVDDHKIRFVTHLDVPNRALEIVESALESYSLA